MKILLIDWAARNYSPAPSAWVLRKWRRDGEIYPSPELVGSAYYVESDAIRQTTQREPVVERLRRHLESV